MALRKQGLGHRHIPYRKIPLIQLPKQITAEKEPEIITVAKDEFYNQKLGEDEAFETTSGKIVFQFFGKEDGYSRQSYNDMFSISNTALLLKFVEMLTFEVKGKISELEIQLLRS